MIGDLINFVSIQRDELNFDNSLAWFASLQRSYSDASLAVHDMAEGEQISLDSVVRELEFLTQAYDEHGMVFNIMKSKLDTLVKKFLNTVY